MNGQIVDAVHSVDQTFLFIFGVSVLLLVGILGTLAWFVYRYSRKRHPMPADFDGNLWAEIIWTVIPTLLVLGMFASGWSSFKALRQVPAGALEIQVTGRQWTWDFEYPNGRKSKAMYVPLGKPVKLLVHSADVIHGFYAPAFRIKVDAVPGLTNYAWFRPEKEGEYVVYCTVYCGLQHAKMLASIRVVPPADFETWLASGDQGEASPGRALLDAKGCLSCHSLDGSDSVGPTLKDVFGRTVVLAAPDGRETTASADAAYLKDSILEPNKQVVKGFQPVMPSYADQLGPEELQTILAFLTNEEAPPAPDGRKVAENEGCLSCHSLDGSILVGPSFKGLWGSQTEVEDGDATRKVPVDRDFVVRLLKDPNSMHIKGFPPVMPAYPDLSPQDLEALLQFLEHLDHQGHEAKP